MTKPITTYQTKSHCYFDSDEYVKAPCADAATCTDDSHWWTDDEEYRSLRAAREFASDDMTDAPAVKIFKVQRIVTTEEIETVGLYGPDEQ